MKDPVTGQPQTETDQYFRGYNAVTWLEGLPVWYFPKLSGKVSDPLGPLEQAQRRVFRSVDGDSAGRAPACV